MREMILNHASLFAPDSDRASISAWLQDAASGMGQLVRDKVVEKSLRMDRSPHETPCLPEYSLHDAYQELHSRGLQEEYLFLVRLVTRVPLLSEAGADVKDRFLGCEEQTLAQDDGAPLVLCAIVDGIAIGFPSQSAWDRDRITVRFNELLPDESIEEMSEVVDQLTRAVHAGPICERHRGRIRAGSNPVTLWENRDEAFPNLVFGPGVEANLRECANQFPTILRKLVDLDRSAGEWRGVGGPAPPWRTKVTPEHSERMKSAAFRATRRFSSQDGVRRTFEWHARFGNGGRIHLRFDPQSRKVEIGYIGPHLPL